MICCRSMLLVIFALLTACSSYEGVFEPACMAHEGDRIELRDGRYKWEWFSDQKLIDENGQVVKQHPDFPKTGRYALIRDRVVFSDELGAEIETRFIVKYAENAYLLSTSERELLSSAGDMPSCALQLNTR